MNRPLGDALPGWQPAADPRGLTMTGRYAHLRPLDVTTDADGLWTAMAGHDWIWDYLGAPAPGDAAAMRARLAEGQALVDQPCYVIRPKGEDRPLGYACYWTVVREMGNIEIGNVNLSPALQGTQIATEAFSLMINWAFTSGYRRVEWKCNALNAPSRRAAQRLGFSYEGVFRQHLVQMGRNRDTAWFAMTDGDWAQIGPAHRDWLDPANFDEAGQQRQALRAMTAPHLAQSDPTQDR